MKYNAFVFLFMILIGCNMPEVKTGKPLSYHFDAPAGIWEASFPLGNGRLGLMPDGGVDTENIVLNEISMWSGSKQDTDNHRHITRWARSGNFCSKDVTTKHRN